MASTQDKHETAQIRVGRDGAPRLIWPSKPTAVERISLPFQVVETINESRATREMLRDSLFALDRPEPKTDWHNKLIWGDNKLVMGSLRAEYAGRFRLIYTDPPFDTGDDFSYKVQVGDAAVTKLPSILEEHAYRDTWGRGKGSYLTMLYERLVLMYELLADDGSLFIHLDWHQGHYVKVLLDEIFGEQNFRNEIIWWYYNKLQGNINRFASNHDVVLWYTKSDDFTFNRIREEREKPKRQQKRAWDPETQTLKQARDEEGNLVYYTETERTIDDVWRIPYLMPANKTENVRYETQKPLAVAERIIEAASNEGDLVGDFFCGSGTTLVAAEKLKRQWVGCDLGRFAIHTTRKRLLNTENCEPFEILNLGAYERQHWQQVTTGDAIDAYLGFILELYDAQQVSGYRYLHGKKANRLVHVGAVDAPVTIDEIEQVMDELADHDLAAADILGWEWEMGLHDVVGEEARRRGLDIRCRQIPREVMKAEAAAAIRFFELAYLELQVDRQNQSARVQLRDFVIPSEELIPEAVRDKITRWSDYIDYWSVDFNFRDDTFHNEWQSFRTREELSLQTESDWHDYDGPGRYAIVVKVIDIFGNDTTKLAEVVIK